MRDDGSSGSEDSLLVALAEAPPTPPPVPFRGTARYAIGRVLGAGTFGVVYEATDRVLGGKVAIKALRIARPEWIYRLKREFRTLSEIRHRNLIRLFELGVEGAHWFIVMELVDGAPITAAAAPLRPTFAQLARGVRAVHVAGRLHRDIKPSNVLVDRDGRVVLLDFGLAGDLVEQGTSSMLVGTPAYMAPERRAGEPATEASDWYAVGVTLFQRLTGRLPIGDGAHPRELDPAIPDELDALCAALTSPDPRARADGDELVARFERGVDGPRGARATAELFVGRRAELDALSEAFDAARREGPIMVVAEGPSGIGKSSLLRRFGAVVARSSPGTLVLAGACYATASIPYQGLDAVIDELVRHLNALPAADARALEPPAADLLANLFPAFRRVAAFRLAPADDARTPGPDDRRRGALALRELLGRLATRGPVVIAIDDLQWGDADSATVLAELLREPGAPHILYACTCRDAERACSPLLERLAALARTNRQVHAIRVLPIAPLGDDDARALLAIADPRAVHLIAEGAGSPFLLQALAWSVTARPSAEIDVGAALGARLADLSSDASRLLRVVAVATRPLPVDIAARAAGLSSARDALVALGDARLVRGRLADGNELIELYHERIADHAIAGLAGEEVRALHRRLAGLLDPDDDERLAFHLAAAGESRTAAVCAARAGRRAMAVLAFDAAARWFQRAIELRAAEAATPDLDLERALAAALGEAGRLADAADAWLRVAAHSAGHDRVRLQIRAAQALMFGGYVARGRDTIEQILAGLGVRMPRTDGRALAELVAQRAALRLRGIALDERRRAPGADGLLRLDALWAAVVGMAPFAPLVAAALQTRHLRLALDTGDPDRVSKALCAEVLGRSYRDGWDAGAECERLVAIADQLLRRVETSGARARLQIARGSAALCQGRIADAHEHFFAAERLAAAELDLDQEVRRASLWRLNALYYMGHIRVLAAAAAEQRQSLGERGNLFGWIWSSMYGAWCAVAADRVADARASADHALDRWPREVPGLGGVWRLLFEQTMTLYRDGGAAAWRATERGQAMARHVRASRGPMVHDVLFARARAAIAAAADGHEPRALLAVADRAAAGLARLPSLCGGALALVVRAATASVRGDVPEAIAGLTRAEPLLEAAHLDGTLAAVRRARGRLIGGDAGCALIDAADAWMRGEAIARPDRWSDACVPGRWA